jgi:hypothetical protein
MTPPRLAAVTAVGLVLGPMALTTSAQALGTFSWQMQPFCNRITVNVVRAGAVYTLDGWDDQCGGSTPRAPVVGSATMNPDGTIAFGLHITTSPSGMPLSVDVALNVATLSGPWRDSAGRTGLLAFGAAAPGSPRPAVEAPGDITAVAAGTGLLGGGTSGEVSLSVNVMHVQTRVSGTCPTGQSMIAINEDGTVVCLPGAGPGDITGVLAGPGLIGGGLAGDVTLAVNFAGTGVATAAARHDHTHAHAAAAETTVIGEQALALGLGAANTAVGYYALHANVGDANTAIGRNAMRSNSAGSSNTATGAGALNLNTMGSGNTANGAMALGSNTLGGQNTAIGSAALASNTEGLMNTAVGSSALLNSRFHFNTAIGALALEQNTTGFRNTATGTLALSTNTDGDANTAAGSHAMFYNTTGSDNTALGADALASGTTGSFNTAVGIGALPNNITGSGNVAIGNGAGTGLTTGSGNAYVLAQAGAADENDTTRIGTNQTRTFISGIRGVTTGVGDAIPVVIDSNGQLGTISSSLRTKDHIEALGQVSRAVFDLRPVQFTYTQPFANGTTPVQYGLIAEEVETVLPELVAYGKDGRPETVKYHLLPTLLLAEVQRLERERAALSRQVAEHAAALAELRRQVEALRTERR